MIWLSILVFTLFTILILHNIFILHIFILHIFILHIFILHNIFIFNNNIYLIADFDSVPLDFLRLQEI